MYKILAKNVHAFQKKRFNFISLIAGNGVVISHEQKSLVRYTCTEADQKHNSVFHLGFYTQQVLLSFFDFKQLLYFPTNSVYLDA